MIAARIAGAATIVTRLTRQAQRIAEARAAARHTGARRWRRARLLWPLFARER